MASRSGPAVPVFDPVEQPYEVDASLPAVPVVRLTPEGIQERFARDSVLWTPEVTDESRTQTGRVALLRPASVLIPIVLRAGGPTMLLTLRTSHLHDHAGQVAFPGGRADPGDVDAVDTALREAEEEVGLIRDDVHILGNLPDYFTITGYRVTPVVGLIHPPFDLHLDSFEVAEAFEVPLQFLMDPSNHRLHKVDVPGGPVRSYYSMPYGRFFIWGATAGMIRNFYHFLRAPH